MRSTFIFISVIFTGFWLQAQNVLPKKFPQVAVSIQLLGKSYSSSDSVKLRVTYTNKTKTVQKVYGKSDTEDFRPMALTAYVENDKGQSQIEHSTREVLSSQLYTEEILTQKGMLHYLKPGEQIRTTVYLQSIPIFKTPDGKLPKGSYKVSIGFFGSPSNVESFKIL